MKQLKFMLAAATAISLATAAQAGTNYSGFPDNFDSATAGDAATTLTGYEFNGADGDDESVVQAGGYNQSANALKVNTGTEPLLRAIDYSTAANAVELDKSKAEEKINSLDIDTMVQFTVTPAGDEVKATGEDKLMIYLKEVTNEVGVVTGTNLMVKALMYRADYFDDDLGETVPGTDEKVDVSVTYEDGKIPAITVGTWYSLNVKSTLVDGVPMFTIKLDDKLLKPAEPLDLANTGSVYFPSLLGTKSTTLTYVGFAGEGLVDDLVVSRELDAPSSVDFTFTWTTAGITSVTYTIGDAEPVAVTSGVKIENLAPNAVLTLKVTPADWYKVADDAVLSYTATKAGDSAVLDSLVTEVTATDLNVTVPAGTPPATTSAALAWAKDAGKTTTAVEEASDHFFNNYLLNVVDLTVEPQIEIVSIDASTTPMTITAKVTDAKGTAYEKVLTEEGDDKINASIKYRAAATLEALKSAALKDDIADTDQFVQVVVE